MMRGNVSKDQNKLVRLIKAPIRILSKARDSYVRSWGDSTQSVCYSRTGASSSYSGRSSSTTRHALPRSFSTSVVSVSSSGRVYDQQVQGDDDFRELVRVASVRTMARTMEMDMIEERRARRFGKRQQQQQPNGVSRSVSVGIGMGRIDEDEACEFVEEEVQNQVQDGKNKKKTKKNNNVVDDVGKKNGMFYPRSRSHAVRNHSSLMMMS